MSAEIKTITELPKKVIAEVKSEAKPATSEGIVNQAVGFAIGIPISMFYDWIFELVASKAITNDIARDIIKIAMPLGIGVSAHVAKIPFGNYIAGTGYAVAAISAGRILYSRIKGMLGAKTETEGFTGSAILDNLKLWGVQT